MCENAKIKMCNGNNGSSSMISSNQISETMNVKINKQVVMISACRMCTIFSGTEVVQAILSVSPRCVS